MSTRDITRLLVANRGEIALRIMRSARRMGLTVIGVFSDADENAPHVRFADEAVRIGPPASRDSYLSIEKLIEAARRTGADALHPGYGFLSERAELAEACADAGLVFVGPTPKAIRAMGLKREAKQIARAAGVPVVPGYDGAEQSPARLIEEARQIGLPVLVKASAGGGGKGMRIVRAESELEAAIAAARREAESSFGDGTLLLERYIERPRHVEVQILGDAHGNLVHLFERECSIQRRHQKIIEETPSTALSPALRAEMGQAAIAIGRAIAYQNAGTVEFIVDPDGRFYFLEVNTRLQVEHPVTEAVTGIDLVAAQLRIARGEPLGFSQADLRQTGAAVECRLYAEDPSREFLPQTGKILDFHVPALEGLRVDAGVEAGSEVGIHYDPMLAKIITWGGTRGEANQRMIRALEQLSVQGVTTNRSFLLRVFRQQEYAAGRIDTHFLERHGPALAEEVQETTAREAAIAAAVVGCLERRAKRTLLPGVPAGWRNNEFSAPSISFDIERFAAPVTVAYRYLPGDRFTMTVAGQSREVRVSSWKDRELVLELDGHSRRFRVVHHEERFWVQTRGAAVELVEQPRFPARTVAHHAGACVAPMPGKVVLVHAAAGQVVEKGAVLLVLEAMKMEHPVVAPANGTVTEVRVAPGDQVDARAVLVVLDEG